MKKLLALSVLIAAVSVPVFADAVFQLDVGIGAGVAYRFIFPTLSYDPNLQGVWYSPKSGLGGGFHVNAVLPIFLTANETDTWPPLFFDVGGDFVWASRTNKGLWNIGAGLTMLYFFPYGFHMTTGYQWAFGNRNHRFALKPSISVMISQSHGDIWVAPKASLSLNYSFNNAQTHGR
jgi:hypothetical protein